MRDKKGWAILFSVEYDMNIEYFLHWMSSVLFMNLGINLTGKDMKVMRKNFNGALSSLLIIPPLILISHNAPIVCNVEIFTLIRIITGKYTFQLTHMPTPLPHIYWVPLPQFNIKPRN